MKVKIVGLLYKLL